MNVWYEFYPSDTLFFRGAEPLDPGINYNTELLFPPPPSVVAGAMRTAVLAQKSVSIKKYSQGHEIEKMIGKYGSTPPFSVIGPVLKKHSVFFVPAPYTYFTEERIYKKKINLSISEPLNKNVKNELKIGASSDITHWVRHKNKLLPLGGNWISLDALTAGKTKLDTMSELLIHPEKDWALFKTEQRTGIELDKKRRVKEGKIYNARHIRLAKDVSLIWGADMDCGLNPHGVLCLGGEQRFGYYIKSDKSPEFLQEGDSYLALGPVEVREEIKKHLIATGKIIYRGGWDYKKQYHKPMKPYYPAGTVFSKKIDENCINFKNN